MKILIIILLLLTADKLFAGEVLYVDSDGKNNKQIIRYDEELSFRNFSGWEFNSRPEYKFSGKTIYNTVFTQEKPDTVVFSADTSNVTFVNCHIENVVIPLNSTIIAPDCEGEPCWTYKFKVQNDLRDWKIDNQGRAKEILNKEFWVEKGYSVKPEDIPPQKIEKVEDAPKAGSSEPVIIP